jgi:signal peptidase II
VKLRSAILLIALVIIIDQALKIWIKTSFPLGPVGNILGLSWARLYFIENEGMAWGWKLGGDWGKMILTLFRLVAVIFGTWYIGKIVKQRYHRGFIVCASLIYAGALGNLIDSMFYGMIFDKGGYTFNPAFQTFDTYSGVASFSSKGYSSFLHGSVVDMLYFPMVESTFPSWVPFVGGKEFEFFSPIFNIADAAISIGVITLLLFQKRFFHREQQDEPRPVTTNSPVSDQTQVM